MSDTLTRAFEAAGRDLPPSARDILASRLTTLRAHLGAGPAPAPTADQPMSGARERQLLEATSAGRRVLASRDGADSPDLTARERQLLEASAPGRAVLRDHDAAHGSPSARLLGAVGRAWRGAGAPHTDTEIGR